MADERQAVRGRPPGVAESLPVTEATALAGQIQSTGWRPPAAPHATYARPPSAASKTGPATARTARATHRFLTSKTESGGACSADFCVMITEINRSFASKRYRTRTSFATATVEWPKRASRDEGRRPEAQRRPLTDRVGTYARRDRLIYDVKRSRSRPPSPRLIAFVKG